jgi:hypothetical protein
MSRVQWASCCAVVSIATIFFPTIVVAQAGNLFGPDEDERGVPPLATPGDLEPEPALAPLPAVDPTPAAELALPGVAGAPAVVPRDFCRCVGDGASAQSVNRIRAALAAPLRESGLKFEDQPLQDVVGRLEEEYGISIKLDTAALNDLGIPPDQPVNINLRNISLRSALRLLLKELGLTYIIQDEVLLITSPDEAETQLKICVYDVRDLIDPMNAGDMDSLRDTIASCVAKETWAVNGKGEAEIKSLRPGLLVISQTQAVQEEVQTLLESIRSQQHAQPAAAALPGPAVGGVTDDTKVVTRSYYLQVNQQPGGESFSNKIYQLIAASLPDEQWQGRLDNGQPVVLTVLPDRVVVRHRESVQQKVQSLLVDSGLSTSPASVAGETGGQGGFGGGGGGFFNHQPAERQ